jgi:GTP-binding protein Era
MPEEELKKSGLAVLVGRSNVGKSTLLNALVGSKIAITTPKPQTTRHLIQGVVNDDRGQAVFVDTPGLFKRVPDRLTAKLNEKAKESLAGVDCLLYVVDPTRHVGEEEKLVRSLVAASNLPKILVINKSDLRGEFKEEYLAWADEFDAVLEVSAAQGKGLGLLKDAIFEALPEGEPLYPLDRITDVENKFWIAETIREKAFLQTHQEIPFGLNVEVLEVEERENGLIYIHAALVTRDARHKRMLIGQGARKIKQIGASARKEMELVSDRKIFLELDVEVDEKWQERFE